MTAGVELADEEVTGIALHDAVEALETAVFGLSVLGALLVALKGRLKGSLVLGWAHDGLPHLVTIDLGLLEGILVDD